MLAIIIDFVLEASMDEALLAAPLSMCVIVILGLVTFGADDFLDFLIAFFIELGIMIFERTYFPEVVNAVIDYLSDQIPRALEAVKSLFSSEDGGEEVEGAATTAEAADG